jgi:hypothetical protein
VPSAADVEQAVVVLDRPRIVGVAARFGITDPVIAAEFEEAVALLPRKRRLTLFGALEHGNMSRAVLEAGSNVKDVRSAADVARDIEADPLWQHAFQSIQEAQGLSTAKLDGLLAIHASRHSSPHDGDRTRSLQATIAVKKIVSRARAQGTGMAGSVGDQLLSEMTVEELRACRTGGVASAIQAAPPRSREQQHWERRHAVVQQHTTSRATRPRCGERAPRSAPA